MRGRRSVESNPEVIPPGRSTPLDGDEGDDSLVRILAALLDTAFCLPGTNFRFGLDPLIGAIPGVGDTLSALIAVFLIIRSARYGLPKIVLARMALNVIINAVGGTIPVIGDAFSFWYKSNAMNYALLKKHAFSAPKRASIVGDWVFVVGLVGGTVLLLFFALYGFISLVAALFSALHR